MRPLALPALLLATLASGQGLTLTPSVTAAQEAGNIRTVTAMYRALLQGDLPAYRSSFSPPLATANVDAQQLVFASAPFHVLKVRTITAKGNQVTMRLTRSAAGITTRGTREYTLQHGEIVKVREYWGR